MLNFNVDETVACNFGSQAVVIHDIRREVGIGDVHLFISVKESIEVLIGDVHVYPLCFAMFK